MSNERAAGANSLAASGIPRIYNVLLELSNTEYIEHLPIDCRKFSIQTRNPSHTIKLAYTAEESGTNFITVQGCYWEDLISATALWIFMQSPDVGAVVEIVAWN